MKTAAAYPMPRDASAFDKAAMALNLLSDGPWVEIAPSLWAELTAAEQATLARRADHRGVALRNTMEVLS